MMYSAYGMGELAAAPLDMSYAPAVREGAGASLCLCLHTSGTANCGRLFLSNLHA